jgi:hypothetical protein
MARTAASTVAAMATASKPASSIAPSSPAGTAPARPPASSQPATDCNGRPARYRGMSKLLARLWLRAGS